jgi:hypothetical protein
VGHTLIVVPDEAVVRREKSPAAEPSPEPDVTVPTMEPRWVQTAPTIKTTRLRPATSAPVEWERH